MRSNSEFLRIARKQMQRQADDGEAGDVALLVKDDEIVATGQDRRRETNNPIACAEMECIRLAGRRTDQASLALVTTGYPNLLVAGTILQFSIGVLVIGQPPASSPAIDLLQSKGVPVTFCADDE